MHNFNNKFNNKENIYFGAVHSARNSTKRAPFYSKNKYLNGKENQAENLKLNINIVPSKPQQTDEENNYPSNLFQSYGPTGEIYNKETIK